MFVIRECHWQGDAEAELPAKLHAETFPIWKMTHNASFWAPNMEKKKRLPARHQLLPRKIIGMLKDKMATSRSEIMVYRGYLTRTLSLLSHGNLDKHFNITW